ncbi:hypothetical protein Hanom_Chr17g01558581 [Helianthus anomalus]
MYIRYRYPLLRMSVTVVSIPVTELIKSFINVAIQVIVPFRLLFLHTLIVNASMMMCLLSLFIFLFVNYKLIYQKHMIH